MSSLSQTGVMSPPTTFAQRIKYLGPSLIVTANIVGAGELIMTTTLGAEVGFIALWIILISCAVKVMIQLEFGKHAINTGETTLQAFTKLPGPKIGRGHWSIWTWLLIKAVQFIQMGGMVGGVALAMHIAIPQIPVWAWAWITALTTITLVLRSYYKRVESIAIILVSLFSVFTIFCVFLLQSTPYAVSWSEISSGFDFQLPAAVVGVALAAFGITGMSSEETISYPYWCLEKGYGKFTGKRDDSNEWSERAKGWISVMYMDAFISMIIYTIATGAFYILGASILHRLDQVPRGYDTISTLSQIYTESVGPWAEGVFLFGAVIVLFSSLFINAATNQRTFTDAFAQLGILNYEDEQTRNKWFTFWAIFLPSSWAVLFVAVQAPVIMITIGGISLTALLLLVVFAALHFRYVRLDKRLHPILAYDILLWLSGIIIMAFGIYALGTI